MSDKSALKKKLVHLITMNMGKHTGKLFDQFFHSDDPKYLISQAETVLTEFEGKKKAIEELEPIRKEFINQ